MKTKKYFIISAIALLACSCRDEEQGGVQPTPGEEVQFGATLEQITSRTVYGEQTETGFPINWVTGDEVVVFSPDCAASQSSGGVGSAIYKVNVGENSGEQNYANSLDKTGEIGVRWGQNATGRFYSIYPASSLYTKVSGDCKSVTLTMPAQQDMNFTRNDNGIIVQPDMRACFMYANTSEISNGKTVDLQYKPLTTAIRLKLQGPQDDTNGPVTVTYVRIHAPNDTYINGTYTFKDVTDGSGIPEPTNGLNYVTMNVANATTGAYLTLGKNESAVLTAFLLLGKETIVDENWSIEVGTSIGVSYELPIRTTASAESRTLKPGKVHILSDLPPLTSDKWNASNWMANLQRNVYLSEISIPGAWYSMHSSYQPDANASSYSDKISNLYSNGVRAFHLDTRWRGTTKTVFFDTYLDEVKDLGVIDTDNHSFNEYGVTGGDKYLYYDNGAPSFEECLNAITEHVSSDEYMVVICTFAQGSGNYKKYGTSGDGGWREAIRDACEKNSKVIDAADLSPNTTVADVLGEVIVIVNTYTPNAVTGRPLYVNLPMELSDVDTDITVDGSTSHKQGFTTNDYFRQPLKYMNSTETGITMYATYAQATTGSESGTGSTDSDRGYMPTFAERKEKAQNILKWSQENYNNRENYSHNSWIYLGLGGYIPGRPDNYTNVSASLNSWINGKVEEMETNQAYYPVGIVLMNEAINYANVVKNILQMNNKYRKAYDPNRSPVTGDYINDSANSVQSAAPGYSSGMKDNQTDAIGWTRCK